MSVAIYLIVWFIVGHGTAELVIIIIDRVSGVYNIFVCKIPVPRINANPTTAPGPRPLSVTSLVYDVFYVRVLY